MAGEALVKKLDCDPSFMMTDDDAAPLVHHHFCAQRWPLFGHDCSA
jgi:hypothetical protein